MVTNYESGKKFEKEIDNSLKYFQESHSNFYYYRIKDAIAHKARGKQFHKVPCDHIAAYKGIAFYIEEKSSRADLFYDLKYIRQHQYDALLQFWNAGCQSWFFIAKRLYNPNITDRVWAISISKIKDLREAHIGRIYWNSIEDYGIELLKIKGRVNFIFDLEPIFVNSQYQKEVIENL